MGTSLDNHHDLVILESIEQNPDATQASLAVQLGVAVSTVNWHLKRLISKGYVKVRRAQRRKLRYIITPEGITLRAHLTIDYIQSSFHLYRLVRHRMIDALNLVRKMGYRQVRLEGVGDVAEICRLTCLEQGIPIVEDACVPMLTLSGLKVFMEREGLDTGRGPNDE
jgi:DNA-binding MarR family transcriptional regulator